MIDGRPGPKNHEPLQAAEANAPVLGHDAAEVSGFRQGRTGEAGTGKRGPGRGGKLGRDPGSGVCEAGSQDRVFVRVSAEDGSAGVHLLREKAGINARVIGLRVTGFVCFMLSFVLVVPVCAGLAATTLWE